MEKRRNKSLCDNFDAIFGNRSLVQDCVQLIVLHRHVHVYCVLAKSSNSDSSVTQLFKSRMANIPKTLHAIGLLGKNTIST